jgi:2-octaprenyl-3-methyl-6-methoxy-1,4-benzoquinol hydroxylase/2-octaprenylphenol hydroxylase
MTSHDVAVVGAGMVGAALALALAREGFDVAVLDAREPPPWRAGDEVDLRVVALAPSAADLFGRLDVWTSIASARASPFRRMRVWDALAPGELAFDSAERGEAALGWIVENRLIQHMLWRALAADGRVALRVPARVVGTTADGQWRTLALDDGTSLRARLVVAADGADSALRDRLGIAVRERDYHQRAIVAHVATERAHQATAWQRFLPGGTLAFLPLADGRSSIVWSVPEREAARLLALDDAAFCAELGAAFDFRLGRIVATTPRAALPLRLRLAERYLAPRAVLVGDAAHVVHPLAGQGVNLGLRDVAELVATLTAARSEKRDFAAEYTLRRYARRRRSDDTLSAHAFDAIQRLFGSAAPPLAALRGAGLALVDRLTPLKRALVRHAAGR